MFGLLKNKLASFIKGLSGKEEQKIAQPLLVEEPKAVEAQQKIEIPALQQADLIEERMQFWAVDSKRIRRAFAIDVNKRSTNADIDEF